MPKLCLLCGLHAAALALVATTATAQLSPPAGPVSPTEKPLGEVEPRTAIDPADLPVVIKSAGSYYLTGGYTHRSSTGTTPAILVEASDVRIDLMGFTMVGRLADADGVAGPIVGLHAIQLAPDVERVRIRNGGMTGWSGSAVHSDGRNGSCVLEDLQIDEAGDLELFPSVMLGDDARVRDVTISGGPGAGLVADGGVFDRVVVHGCEGDGFVINDGAVLRGCHAEGNAAGIIVGGSGVLDSCGAHDNRGSGIVGGVGMTVSDCGASGNGGTGIRVLTGSTLTGCNAEGNSSDGISVGSGSTVIGCNARNNEVHGIVTGDDAQVRHCNADSNRIHGIVTGARCHITDNHASNSGRGSDQGRSGIGNWPTGIRALGTDCVIERNLTTRNRYGWVGEGGAGFTQIVINNKSIRDVRGCGAYTGAGSTTGAQLTQTGLIQTFSPYVNFCLKAGEPDP